MLTNERVYLKDHPDVVNLTERLHQIARNRGIHDCVQYDQKQVNYFASCWMSFSTFLPGFLCRGIGKIDRNEIQHYLMHIAWEELGGKNPSAVHSKLFLEACDECDIEISSPPSEFHSILKKLDSYLEICQSNAEILGLFLALEIIAEENIKLVHTMLGGDQKLTKSLFFKIHFVAEEEHIRLSVANFLKFCTAPENELDFMHGLDLGLNFWQMFWRHFTTAKGESLCLTR